ncbi:Probable transmembrane protein [Pseudoalteromonas luteoviolacea B = ATCC 29581]|nr:Probable transmembrane protein [Pseudoalteromonas luteoviolacea B = ATCC 29581]
MEPLFLSTVTVTLAEIGDKTQLLALLLIIKYKQPVQIMLGIVVATLVNHLATAYLGASLDTIITKEYLHYLVSASFLLLGLWLLIPDKEEPVSNRFDHFGVFSATTILFFLAELGDKTQVATALLASQFDSIVYVTIGSTLGMLAANVPVLYFGEALLKVIPLTTFRVIAATVTILIGLYGFYSQSI